MVINLLSIVGIQALKILREDPVTQPMPVLILSADAKPLKLNEWMDARGIGLALTKTVSFSGNLENNA